MVKMFTKIFGTALGLLSLLGLSVESNAQYCTPSYSIGCTSGDNIKDVILNGANGTMISNLNTTCPAGGYMNYTTSTAPNMTCTLIMGMSYTGNVTTNYSGTWESVKVWIDFNQNNTFETTEVVATLDGIGAGMPGNITVNVPVMGVSAGPTRMRVRLNYVTTAAGIDPCNSVTYGECHDYTVTIIAPGPPNNAGVKTLVTPNSGTEFCSNSFQPVSVSVKNLGSNAIDSVKVNWSVNGVLQSPVSVNTTLPYYLDSTVVLLGNAFFPDLNPVSIHAWTSMPNGVVDADFTDDSLKTSYTADKLGVYINVSPGDTFICSGTSVVLDAGTHPYNPIYVWNNAEITQTISVSTPGTYIVKVQNNEGCVAFDTVNIVQYPDPVVNSIPIIDLGGGAFQFNVLGAANYDEYRWDFGDGNTTNWSSVLPIAQQNHTYGTNGEFDVKFCMRNLCKEVCTIRKMVISNAGTSVRELNDLKNAFEVYPNPAKSLVTISNNAGIAIEQVVVFNIYGQQVANYQVGKVSKFEMNLNVLSAGLYNVVVSTEQGKFTKKLEVLK